MIEKISIIEQHLLSIDPTQYQLLCLDFLVRKHPNLKEFPHEYGKALGADKVKKGVPDIYFTLSNGNYVYVECNTEKGNVFKKLKRDLLKCFKTGINDEQIEKIFLCYTGNIISPSEDHELNDIAQKKRTILEIIDIDSLKIALRTDYQYLAEKYFGIQIDSGQILDKVSFLETQSYNKLSTGFNQKLFGRTKEIEEVLLNLLSNNIIILSGSAGVGKTKLGIEICNLWCNENPSFSSKFISPKSGRLNSEIYDHFENNADYIILVDDAFRLDDLEEVFYFNNRRIKKLKIILTVRDFTLRKIDKIITHLQLPNIPIISIERLKDEVINELLKDEGVINTTCQYKINKLVNGNPRLALMAAQKALLVNNCDVLNNISEIYDFYFKPYLNERNLPLNAIKSLGILSTFKIIRYYDDEIHSNLESAFGINKNQLWDNFDYLCQNELVEYNNSENPDSVRIIDQTLASYIFYKVFVEDKLLSFTALIKFTFSKNKGRIRDALRPILESYGYEYIRATVKPLVDEARIGSKDFSMDEKFEFYDEFSFCQENEIIIFMGEVLEKTESIPFQIENLKESNRWYYGTDYKFINLAKKLNKSTRHTTLAFQIVLKYLEKHPSNFKEVVEYLKKEVYIHSDDHENGYSIQVKLFEIILKEAKHGSKFEALYQALFKEISGKYLQIIAKGISPRKSLDSFRIHNIYIDDVEAWNQKRMEIWHHAFTFLKTDITTFKFILKDALELNSRKTFDSPILEKESRFVISQLNEILDPTKLSHCLIAYQYLDFIKSCKIKTKSFKLFFEKYNTQTYKHYKILAFNYGSYSRKLRRHERRVNFEFRTDFIKVYLTSKTKYYTARDYIRLIESFEEASKEQDLSHNLTIILIDLFEKSKNIFLEVIIELLKSGNKGKLSIPIIMEKLLLIFLQKEEELWYIIDGYDYELKEKWKIDYLLLLPIELIEKKHFELLISSITSINYVYLHKSQIERIKKFEQKLGGGLFIKTFKKIIDLCMEEKLNFHSYDLIESFSSEFVKSIDTLKKLYFYLESNGRGYDYNGNAFKAILSLDNNFILEYLNHHFPKKYGYNSSEVTIYDWSFLWEYDDFNEKISNILAFFSNEQRRYYNNDKLIKGIFSPKTSKEKIISFLKVKIFENLNDINYINLIFNIVIENLPEERLFFFEYFIKKNPSLEIFISLPIRPSLMVYSGEDGRIFSLKKDIEFWEQLQGQLFDDITYLKHIEYINQRIIYLKKDIEYEKRERFWRDY